VKFILKPVDTFFFRNHKALVPGEDSEATGLFPPRPGTVYGALRSAYIHEISDFNTFRQQTDAKLLHWMGSTTSIGEFRLQAHFWQDQHDLVFPCPFDHQVVEQQDEVAKGLRLRLVEEPEAQTWGSDQAQNRLYGRTEAKSKSPANRYVYRKELEESLLTGGDLTVHPLSRWIAVEPKIGIAHDWRTKQTKKGMFYSMGMLRFVEDVQLVAYSNAAPADFRSVDYVSLGGKQRPWNLKVATSDLKCNISPDDLIQAIENTGIARIILLTPAVWDAGTRPSCWDPVTDELIIGAQRYPVLTAAIGRPMLIGGWDIANNRPKPRQNAVPAGTVLYLKVEKNTAANLVKYLHEQNFSDQLTHEGYGYTWVGCGQIEQ